MFINVYYKYRNRDMDAMDARITRLAVRRKGRWQGGGLWPNSGEREINFSFSKKQGQSFIKACRRTGVLKTEVLT